MKIKYIASVLFSFFYIHQACSQVVEEEEQTEDLIEYEGEILDTAAAFPRAIDYSAEVNLRGMISGQERLPFWMYKNQRGRVSEDSNFSGWITGKAIGFVGPHAFMEVGAAILYQNGTNEAIVPDELYVHFENSWLQVTAGRKQRPALYHGLSASNENILWSLNARPLPGVQLQTNGPVFLAGETGIGFEASWNEYLLGKDRHLEDARLHRKSFHLVYRTNTNFQIKAGFQHFAHWGGSNPDTEVERPKEFKDYLEAVAFKNPSQNHLSSYEIYVSKDFRSFRLELLYNHIAVDPSGRHLGNTPDGRYGIFYESLEQDRIINAIMYEFYYTNHQSYDRSGYVDDYFNHWVYSTGWAYKNRIIGAPFFLYDAEEQRVINNKFTAHHIGLKGQFSTVFKTYPYELLLSYARNDGTYDLRLRPKQSVFSTYLDFRVFQSFIDVNIQLATEITNTASPIYGAALHLKYRL